MFEKIMRDYLDSRMSVPVYLERPKDPPQKFVLIERTGAREVDHIQYATLAVQSIADRLYDAIELNEEAIEAVKGAVELEEIGSVYLNSFYNFTNRYQADRDEHRYQAIFEIVYY